MRVLVSDAVNGGGIVEKLFWDFDGKLLRCRRYVKITLMRICGVASEREVLGGEVGYLVHTNRQINCIKR